MESYIAVESDHHEAEDLKMEMSLSRKILNISSIFEFISGGLMFLLGILTLAAGYEAMHDPACMLPEGLLASSFIIFGILFSICALVTLIYGVLQRRAAKDPAKITPVWVMSLAFVVINTFIIIYYLFQDFAIHAIAFELLSLSLAVVVFIASDIIKKEADFGL